ncbi:MAG TPA: hypothetical protein VK900_01675 [Anaerolineales bacterium]|nr:hypothetical protein [Anaerolineales bacterium]
MKKISRLFLFGALSLALLTAACAEATPTTIFVPTQPAEETASPPPLGTDAMASPVGVLETPTVTGGTELTPTPGTDTTQTAEVPVTGGDLILLECQFCIQDTAHALLVLPESATFETVADTAAVSTPGPDSGCNTVDTYNGRQVILCRSQENTSVNLNICTDATNCTQLLVELQDCPDVVQPGATATGTLEISLPTNTGEAGVTDTPDPAVNPTATP